MFKLIKTREIAKYSSLDDIEFISFENDEKIAEFGQLPNINDLFNYYNLIDYESLKDLVLENKQIEVDTYELVINDTYNIIGFKIHD